jgi:hypothetical protein
MELEGQLSLIHIFATPDGETHLVERPIAQGATIPAAAVVANSYRPRNIDWHPAPRRQFAINMTGVLEAEVSDGTRRRIGPGELVFLEDTVGKGHVTRLIDPVTNLFIRVADDFDLLAWTRGE